MSSVDWWNSYARVDATFRAARGTALVTAVLAILGWSWPSFVLAVPASVIALTAVLVTLFTWFRRDDLCR